MPQTTPSEQGAAPSSTRSAMNTAALETRTRAEQLAAVLDTKIRNSEFSPGQLVGTLESLRAETGFGYATVSEAVRLLRDRGVLEIRPGRGGGLFAAEAGPAVRMRHTLLSVSNDPTAVADAIELREHLEPLIDVAAARHRNDHDVDDLREHLGRMKAAETEDEFIRANWALHERIAGICPNEMARAVYVGTLGQLSSTSPRIATVDSLAYRRKRLRVHVQLVDAIASGDEAAVREIVDQHNGTA